MENGYERNAIYIKETDIEKVRDILKEAKITGAEWLGWSPRGQLAGLEMFALIADRPTAEDYSWNHEREPLYDRAYEMSGISRAITDAIEHSGPPGKAPSFIRVDTSGVEETGPLASRMQAGYLRLGEELRYVGPWHEAVRHALVMGMRSSEDSFSIIVPMETYGQRLDVAYEIKKAPGSGYGLDGISVRPGTDDTAPALDDMLLDWTQERFDSYVEGLQAAGDRERELAGRPAQFFPLREDFRLTVDHACNLYQGRYANLPVPGTEGMQRAWYMLDPALRDGQGNRMLLRLGEHSNYRLSDALKLIRPVAEFSEEEVNNMARHLKNGSVLAIHGADEGTIDIAASPPRQGNKGFIRGKQIAYREDLFCVSGKSRQPAPF